MAESKLCVLHMNLASTLTSEFEQRRIARFISPSNRQTIVDKKVKSFEPPERLLDTVLLPRSSDRVRTQSGSPGLVVRGRWLCWPTREAEKWKGNSRNGGVAEERAADFLK